jgi:Concanavalin A-like lectin/glucanases superfamily/Common central domain of tyrosinase
MANALRSPRRVFAVCVLVASAQQASALEIGDPVRTVTLPAEINCPAQGNAHVAISVATVPASDVGVTGIGNKALLATSCRNSAEGNTIYFLDPGSSDTTMTNVAGTIVHRLMVDVTPPNGWGALAFRGDVQPHDLIACSNPATDAEPHSVYSINLSTGHAEQLFELRDAAGNPTTTAGRPFCDGLAWDSGSDTIYHSPDIASTVYHYAFTSQFPGTLLDTLTVPTACSTAVTSQGPAGNSGIVDVGPDLLLACDGLAMIFEVSKKDGSVVRPPFPSGANRAEDMECDSTTFGPDLSVAWTKDAFEPQFLSFVVPPGTCGLCRSAERRDLNNDLTSQQRADLAALELEYLSGAIVAEHRVVRTAWHGAPQFFPGHRGYLGEFEFWLQNVKNRPEFVPLPKWNPANPIPPEFQGTDTAACTDSTQLPPATSPGPCSGIINTNINAPLPSQFVYSGGPTTGLCTFSSVEAVQIGGLEGYHNSVHGAINGTMGNVLVSPSSLIFLPWHAFVDDVAYKYESACKKSSAVCTDVFTPFMAGDAAATESVATAAADASSSPLPNLGFWWWFEDEVVPPAVSPRFVTDHSGFFIPGEVRGNAKLVPGLVGQAIELDGKEDFVIVDDQAAGEVGTSDFTLDGWVRTTALDIQPIVDKVSGDGVGYALFLKDGQLGLFLGTTDRQGVFLADAGSASIADGAWHHVAAVVDREYATRSKLFVDGQVVLQFDATPFAGDATSHAHLWIGHLHVVSLHRLQERGDRFFKGQLDELDLFRSALPPDQVASIFVAGSAGKFGSLGNLPTSAGQPPCIDALAQRIAALPPASAAPLNVLYSQLLAAITRSDRRLARQLAQQIGDQAEAGFDRTYMTGEFHAVAHLVHACLGVPPLGGPR